MSEQVTDGVLVTGANGHLGRLLIRALAHDPEAVPVRAVVRSERAARSLDDLPHPERRDVRIVDYRDRAGLTEAARGCGTAIHLVGILKQTRVNRYVDAHERPAEALSAACAEAGVSRIVHTSILGADPASRNGCLASRGRTDEILLASPVPAVILRVPMVLGPGDPATDALRRQATAGRTSLVRGGAAVQQPIAAADVMSALLAAARPGMPSDTVVELGGPESLTHRALVERTAAVLGADVRFGTTPLFAAHAFAWLAETLFADPPLTRDMLGVLEQDDAIDPEPARAMLGIELTSLDAALRAAFAEESAP
ncbi:MAG: NAD(P)H-binding protein [Gammaproteobacteria bacterium]|nr:NAD(P)H-binding protein [Gammaproteobacteria bacterium]